MRKDASKIQIGDTLYEANTTYSRVFKYKVRNIWIERYSGIWITGFYLSSYDTDVPSQKVFTAQVCEMFNTRKRAENALQVWQIKEKLKEEERKKNENK